MINPYFAFTLLIIALFLVSGCSSVKEVYIPVKAKIEKPKRPKLGNNIVENYKQVLIYTEQLEFTLKKVTDDNN